MSSTLYSAEEDVTDFTPGEKMVFPMRSEGVAVDLARLYAVNCRSKDPNITVKCENMVRKRGMECEPKPPEVFESKNDYKLWATEFSRCVFPLPICGGLEVTSDKDCKAAME
jgi:hypothetical protein